MSLEDAVLKLTEALNANTEAVKAALSAQPAAPAAEGPKPGRGRPKIENKPEPPVEPELPVVDELSFDDAPSAKYTLADVKAGLSAFAKKDVKAATPILTKRGYKGLGQITEADAEGVAADVIAAGGTVTATG